MKSPIQSLCFCPFALISAGMLDSPEVKNSKASITGYPDTWRSYLDNDQLPQLLPYNGRSMGVEFAKAPGLPEKFEAFTKNVRNEIERRENSKMRDGQRARIHRLEPLAGLGGRLC